MKKPALLREALTATFDDLKQNPDKITMYIIEGGIDGQKHTLSHTKRYTLRVLITDWVSPMEQVTATILEWLQIHQPQKLQSGGIGQETMHFEAEVLDNHMVDLLYEIQLNEKIIVLKNELGMVEIQSHPEPSIMDLS